ncbi:HD-GYP domain, c-di-GMP phosphodiesterase class II (or its inactivated variant) [Clostridium cavendishii DSM 21758]|uniref:HD-GYP domain, c-di-GMP phosphodiesterase class II (Or its inactivated variant) n=1 Tax=Clostridium cavendishii DSM 21758 TaxID=1121302 RepID=A0A1M6HYJ6_9CLOT|nr:HD-GYP domain-containing protein [Clostridium cavendishii]SHJ27258.1 HD-GYP domain, c-di-GMP phosphodiesterase class II (or its inactivated variant) [Clostridium cavendishii DSM 21758]
MIPSKKLLVNQLKIGMVSAKDIVLNGKILLAKDVIITDSIINKLKVNYVVDKIEVYSDNDSISALTLKEKTVEEIEKDFNEFSSNLENVFDNLSTVDLPKMVEIRAFIKKVQAEFNSPGIIIKNIVFYGSKNDTIYRHSLNVTAISFILGKWLGLDERNLNLLTYSAILHDFGKSQIDEDILNKEGNLTDEEYEIFKTHPIVAYRHIEKIPYINSAVSRIILMHHEKNDGSGYPLQAKENQIPKLSKIIAIADLFDQVSSDRYSQKINGPFSALQAIKDESLTKLDYTYCDTFLSHIANYYIGENVILNNKKQYKIIQIDLNDLERPLLLDDNGFLDLKKEKDLYIENLVI